MRQRRVALVDRLGIGVLRRFGLEGKADVHPFLLSGGEKRRLSVGTALITRPQVLALDELGKVHVVKGDDCIACGQCELRCPDYAIFVDKAEEAAK